MRQDKRCCNKLYINVYTVIIMMIIGVMIFVGNNMEAYATGNARVTARSANIRSSVESDSEVVASVKSNDKLSVKSQTTSSDGYTWYKVFVDANTLGYIRADLVEVSGTIPKDDTVARTPATNSSTSTPSPTPSTTTPEASTADTTSSSADIVSPSTALTARVISDGVRVRGGANTGATIVDNAKINTECAITGEISADGQVWYQVEYTKDNKQIKGFVRGDFVEVLTREETPAPEEVEPEAEATEPEVEATPEPISQDYTLSQAPDESGVNKWMVNDNINGTSYQLEPMIELSKSAETNGDIASKYKLVAIVLGVLLIIALIAITILIFKLRDSMYEYVYEDDEEDNEMEWEDTRNSEISRRDTRVSAESVRVGRREVVATVYEDDEDLQVDTRRRASARERIKTENGSKSIRDDISSRNNNDRGRQSGGSARLDSERVPQVRTTKGTPTRVRTSTDRGSGTSNGFIDIDDDMEFEFLDMD